MHWEVYSIEDSIDSTVNSMSDTTRSPTPQPQADLANELFPESETGQTRLEAAQEGIEEAERLAEIARGNEKAREEALAQEDDPNEEAAAVELTGGAEELGDEDDLFGDDSDKDEQAEVQSPRSASRTASPMRRRMSSSSSRSERNPLEYDEEDHEPPVQEVVNEQDLLLPRAPRLESSDDKAWQLRLPSYIQLNDQPFHPDVYRRNLEAEQAEKAEPANAKEARAEALETMLKARNTLRWRWVTGPDGRPKRESNARMVKWQDGSMSLQLGNEIYDVTPSGGASFATGSKPATSASSSNTHYLCQLFAQEKVMLAERPIAGHLTLRPASTTNRTHQERAKAIGQQATKHARLKYHEEAHPNPEKEEKERAEMRAKADKQRRRRDAASRPRSKPVGGSSASRTYRKRVRRDSDDDEEAQFSDDSGYARPAKGKRARSHEVGDYEEDDGFVVADDDDDEPEQEEDEASDDAAYGAKKRKSKPKKQSRAKDYDSEPDSMEEAERRIEAQQKEKKRLKKEAAARQSSPVRASASKPSKSKSKSKEYIEDSDDEDAEGEAVDDDDDEDAMEIESEDGA